MGQKDTNTASAGVTLPRSDLRALAVTALVLTVAAGCRSVSPGPPEDWHHQRGANEGKEESPATADKEVHVPPPPFSEGIFPCSECHAYMETNTTVRKLTEEHSQIHLHHGERKGWCFECHTTDNRDMLHLANGELVSFEESYKLCGQCHGPKLRDWRAGVHGKRTGEWNGEKQYLLCAHCHDPHSPRFKPLEPKPPPVAPGK